MMFFEPGEHAQHGLSHDPFKAIVSPRPIGWISTRSRAGAVNLAPYSFFNAVAGKPPIVMFSSEGEKDSVTFARDAGCFAANFAGKAQFDQMNASSAALARGVSEFEFAGVESAQCETIDAPYVVGCPAVLECVVTQIIQQKDRNQAPMDSWTVFGQVVGVRVDPKFVTQGRFDVEKAQPLARLGYLDYSVVERVFSAERPK